MPVPDATSRPPWRKGDNAEAVNNQSRRRTAPDPTPRTDEGFVWIGDSIRAVLADVVYEAANVAWRVAINLDRLGARIEEGEP